ncbi:unnamed protein product [Rotaria sordida]|uniref:Symplekin C-terminal domain-containing protein n=1 Tax=Rotaria sordida TaxID=392033 RepID=A0A819GEQ1_9BILA|nr:unnamed protein product [Rotaria sordida]CAF3882129.1 unnamed protein product [Rotaria sordida]
MLNERTIYTDDVLALVIQQLVHINPIPVLFMQTDLQALSFYSKMVHLLWIFYKDLLENKAPQLRDDGLRSHVRIYVNGSSDGTTSILLLIGELLKQADLYIAEGLHPRILAQHFQLAKKEALQVLDKLKISIKVDRETLIKIARTCLRRKLSIENGDILTDIVVDGILAINEADKPIDLNIVEIMEIQHQTEADSRLVYGIILDHGVRHPSMSKAL